MFDLLKIQIAIDNCKLAIAKLEQSDSNYVLKKDYIELAQYYKNILEHISLNFLTNFNIQIKH
jgi:hypothetical protein